MTAKLLHPQLLCNDINLKTLVDIVLYDEEHLLITCSCFIKRFNLNSKKQANSWITKSWHAFTSGAVRDLKTDNICAVINDRSLSMWPLQENDIENVEKLKFKSRIHSLVPCTEFTYIIYSCGFVECLESGIKTRKRGKNEKLKSLEEIHQYQVFERQNLAALLVKNKEEEICLYKILIDSETNPLYFNKLELFSFNLTGSAISSSGKLLTSWSDGRLYSLDALQRENPPNPGAEIGRLTLLNKNKKLQILELSSSHIALQGMNINEEGGIVCLWDTKFAVTVSTKPLKMYQDPPLAWSVNSGIVVGDGVALVYIPVYLTPSTVASMFGSRIGETSDYHEDVMGWNSSLNTDANPKLFVERPEKDIPINARETKVSNKSIQLVDVIRSFNKGSTSEEVVSDLVVAYLIQQNKLKLVLKSLSSFAALSEKSLVLIIKFLIGLPDEKFSVIASSIPACAQDSPTAGLDRKSAKTSRGATLETSRVVKSRKSRQSKMESPLVNGLDIPEEEKEKKDANSVFSTLKSFAVNQVLLQPFTNCELSNALQLLDFNNSFLLMEHLHYLIASEKAPMLKKKADQVPTLEKVSTWLSLLLDTNYHQLVMTSEAEIHRKLLTCLSSISSLHQTLEASYGLDALVEAVLNSKPLPKTQVDRPYSIETLLI